VQYVDVPYNITFHTCVNFLYFHLTPAGCLFYTAITEGLGKYED